MADNEHQAVLPVYVKQVRRKRSDGKVIIDETLRIYFRGAGEHVYSCPTAVRGICGEFNVKESTQICPIIFSESSMRYKSHGGTVTYHTPRVLEFLEAYLNARIYGDQSYEAIKVKTNIYEHVLDPRIISLLTNWGKPASIHTSTTDTTPTPATDKTPGPSIPLSTPNPSIPSSYLDVNEYQKTYTRNFIPLLAHAQKWVIPLLEHDIYIYLACMTFARGMYSYSLYSSEEFHQRQAGNDISDTDE